MISLSIFLFLFQYDTFGCDVSRDRRIRFIFGEVVCKFSIEGGDVNNHCLCLVLFL